MAVVDVVPVAAHRSDGGGATPACFPISTLLPASAAICICIAASAYYVSTLLSYYATFAVSLVCFARAVWPHRVDAYARQTASRARADLEADLRRLRDVAARGAHPATTAPVHAAAEACARLARATVAGWRRKWDEHRDAACAARFVLRLVALVARLAATVLFDAACDEARAWAPSVLGYLRRVADGIRPPSSSSSCNKGEDDEAAAGFVLKDIVCLVGTGFYLLFTMHLLFSSSDASGMQFCAVCFAATCGLTMVIADWIDPPDDDADETDTTAATDDDSRPEGDAGGEASRDEELEVRQSWRFLWVLVLITHCVDAYLLNVTLGPQPTTLAILALCNLAVLKVGRQVQLTPDDGEGAGAVDKWRRGAMVVYAACSVKVFVVYLVLDCYLAALGFFWLFVMADLLLAEEDNLPDFDTSGEDGEERAGFEGDITGGDEEEVDEETREEHSDTNSSEDEEESSAHCDSSSSEDEEESSVHCDSSEEDEIVEEQRHEGPGYGSGGSTDDSWDLVDVDDPEMPAKANCSAKRRKSRLIPWKHTPRDILLTRG
ncbi:unnamed protein product [Miscanthus lutarioriparius]|uniref:Uncharacterized protein n=1 Tax=Miscanthus lutarioriparius TaxID=422564 RepID=A0A811QVN7_9POAL|nr:unnamed protein product [Miscanthus lutarioriparius]